MIGIEVWKDIKGYEGLYQVSNLGRVRSLNYNKTKTVRTLKLTSNAKGYLQLILHKNGKISSRKVHRLVAEAFIPNPEELPQVNHKDENKTNNCVDNLEWCTNYYNAWYGTKIDKMRKKRSKPILCVETGVIYPCIMEIERQLGIPNTNITACCKGRRKTAGGYHWKIVKDGDEL